MLALTSNRGADDFQYHNEEGLKLYEKVLRLSGNWGTIDNLMYVVGATRAAMLKDIRKIVPEHFLLVPGVGAQGGSLGDVAGYGLTDKCGLLVNSSRAILLPTALKILTRQQLKRLWKSRRKWNLTSLLAN